MKIFMDNSAAKEIEDLENLGKIYSIEQLEQIADENEHIIKLWEPLEFKIDENYEYVPKGKMFSFVSDFIYYLIAYPILKILLKVIYNLKIEGKENIKNLKSGAITVSNHVLFLDCAMIGATCGFKRVYYTTREGSFKIPCVRKLIKLLRAIPIPNSIKNRYHFLDVVDNLLENGNIIHVYPEASMFPYYEKIRNFKNGAFDIAAKNNIPIIPIVIAFKEPKGIRKMFKKKKDVVLHILEPVMPNKYETSLRKRANYLKEEVHEKMQSKIEEK